jgi:hypothetical protein
VSLNQIANSVTDRLAIPHFLEFALDCFVRRHMNGPVKFDRIGAQDQYALKALDG